MKNNFKKSKGFTLIELIIVIIILGVLAVTVAPKFIDVSGDARGAVLEGVQASIQSANTLVHAKVLISGQADGANYSIADTTITIVNQYPSAGTVNNLLDFDTGASASDVTFTTGATSSTFTHVSARDAATCLVTVDDATSAAKPSVRIDTSGC